MPERHNYICLFFMKLDLILLRGNFFSKAKFHNNKYKNGATKCLGGIAFQWKSWRREYIFSDFGYK